MAIAITTGSCEGQNNDFVMASKSETCQACSYMISGVLRGFTKFVFCPHVIHMHCFAFTIRKHFLIKNLCNKARDA